MAGRKPAATPLMAHIPGQAALKRLVIVSDDLASRAARCAALPILRCLLESSAALWLLGSAKVRALASPVAVASGLRMFPTCHRVDDAFSALRSGPVVMHAACGGHCSVAGTGEEACKPPSELRSAEARQLCVQVPGGPDMRRGFRWSRAAIWGGCMHVGADVGL